MRHKEKRRCSPTDFYSVGAERGRAWTELRCARSLCLAREGTACTKVVLQSRVLFRDVVVVGVCYSPWWTFAKLDGYVLAEVTSLLFDVFCWLFLVLLVFLAFPGFCCSFSIVLSVDLCCRFRGIFRVARCPPGGEFCPM